LVQIAATTMPGNSGGPIVDFSGNVVGIISFGWNHNCREYEFCISAAEMHELVADMGKE
jgi:S1-C subfamily serine protease